MTEELRNDGNAIGVSLIPLQANGSTAAPLQLA